METVLGQPIYRKTFIRGHKNSQLSFIKTMSKKVLSFRQEKVFSQVWSAMAI